MDPLPSSSRAPALLTSPMVQLPVGPKIANSMDGKLYVQWCPSVDQLPPSSSGSPPAQSLLLRILPHKRPPRCLPLSGCNPPGSERILVLVRPVGHYRK